MSRHTSSKIKRVLGQPSVAADEDLRRRRLDAQEHGPHKSTACPVAPTQSRSKVSSMLSTDPL